MDNDPLQQSNDGGASGGSEDRAGGNKSGSSSSGQPKFSNGPHIRSRITVVCAECKRLKLKCDRRTPCSSCLKRDTVPRCIYSQAAAEKIDVQSLHNRLLVVEGTLSQLSTSNPSSSSLSSALGTIPAFKSSYPTPAFTQSSSSANFPQGSAAMFSIPSAGGSSLAGLPCNDRSLLATGASGSSVVISLEDVASLWINELDSNLNAESTTGSNTAFPPFTSGLRPSPNASGKGKVKLEPSPVLLPISSSVNCYSSNESTLGDPSQNVTHTPLFIPPVPYTTFLSPATPHADPSGSYSSSHNGAELPQVTPALLQHLPATPAARAHLIRVLNEAMELHPCFNVRHFERRVEAMMAWGESPVVDPPPDEERPKNRELARELFLGIPPARKRNPTLSFFAAAAAAFGLGSLVANELAEVNNGGSAGGASGSTTPSPAALCALSEQALGLFEKTSSYDVDSLIAMILQVLYHLHDGQMRIAQGVFPMVAKMVNVARMMGLGIDPDEFPGTYSLFDAETRRRVWWDVYYYDVYVSDYMGQSPLIAEGSFTTKLPSDVDEQQFTSSSTCLTPASGDDDNSEKSFTFFILKCRLAQLVKSIRKQTCRDPSSEDGSELSIDQVASSESDVTVWLSELPQRYHLDVDPDLTPPSSASPASGGVSVTLTAQKCVLAMTAARIVMKLYLPFLKDTLCKPPHQAVMGAVQAAHTVVGAARQLHSVWKGIRPAALDFYDYGRTIFDAAVVCAHTVIQQPSSILSAQAMKIVGSALDILQELGGAREDGLNDAWKIVDLMRQKAEMARANGACVDDVNAGNKRKRAESEEGSFEHGLQLPFVGASITSAKAEQARPMLALPRPANPAAKEIPSPSTRQKPASESSLKSASSEEKKQKGDKGDKRYPLVGIRVRPGQARPFNRQRTHSLSPNSPLVLNGSSPSSVTGPTIARLEGTPISQSATTISDSSSLSSFSSFRPSPPQPKENPPLPQSLSQDQFQLHDTQRYSHAFSSSSPPMQNVYDPSTTSNSFPGAAGQEQQQHLPASYPANPPQPAENFYPTYTQQGSAAFDVVSGMTDYTTAVEASVPSTPVEHSYLLPSDKHPGYVQQRQHRGKDLSHDYHAQQQQQMMVQGVQGWQHAATNPPPSMWEYKYYNGVTG